MVWFFIFGSSCPVSLLCHLSRIVLICRLLLRFGASRKSPLHQMSALRQKRPFVRVALAIRQPTLGCRSSTGHAYCPRPCWLRHVGGSADPRIWHSSFADLTARIDPYSVVISTARRSEFQSKFACPLEGLCRITRRERHGSGYV